MKMRCFLPIAVVLAVCLWPSGAMAQAGTIPVAGPESRAAVAAGMETRGTGELPGTGEHPAMGDRPGTGEPPDSGRPGAVPVPGSAAGLRQRALAAMEMLREEIVTLAALKNAQEALLAWNRGLAEADVGSATLASALCNDTALSPWCPLLPATFGPGERPGTGELPGTGVLSGTPSPRAEDGHDGE